MAEESQQGEPAEVVLAFVADYFRWNQAAYKRMCRAGNSEAKQDAAVETAMAEVATLLGPYFVPGSTELPCAFGDSSSHEPGREVITSVKTKGDNCVVSTRMTQRFGEVEMIFDYKYQMASLKGRWYVKSIKQKIVDAGG